MRIFVALIACSTLARAFVPTVPFRGRVQHEIGTACRMAEGEGEKEEPERVAPIGQSPMETGTHEELMYALGVNLARQLGDVRPLVENGDELAQVAKGLLDTVIGRLTEDGQQELLARRGKDLNEIIQARA